MCTHITSEKVVFAEDYLVHVEFGLESSHDLGEKGLVRRVSASAPYIGESGSIGETMRNTHRCLSTSFPALTSTGLKLASSTDAACSSSARPSTVLGRSWVP